MVSTLTRIIATLALRLTCVNKRVKLLKKQMLIVMMEKIYFTPFISAIAIQERRALTGEPLTTFVQHVLYSVFR